MRIINWILSLLFPYKGVYTKPVRDGSSWSIRKMRENDTEYGGYNLKDM